MRRTDTQKITLSGLMTAFAVIIMLLSNIFSVGNYTFPAFSGIVIWILSLAVGKSYSWSSFAATSALSFMLCANKEAPLCFLLLFGYYPLLREHIDKIKTKLLSYIVRLFIFNTSAVAIYFLSIYVFGIPQDLEIFGVNLPFVFLIALNVAFLLYDNMLTIFNREYKGKINRLIAKIFKNLR